jgi:hypothetical protein
MRLKIYLLLVALTTLSGFNQNVYADGFPIRPGRLLVSASYNYFYADQLWDQSGNKGSFPYGGSFTAQSINLYGEFGLSRKFTIVTSIPYVFLQSKNSLATNSTNGFGDAETGLRYYLFNIGYRYYFSLQAGVTTPLYSNTVLGYNQLGGELKLAVAGTGKLFGNYYYFNLENGVRQFFDSNGPIQDRYTGVFGLGLDKHGVNQLTFGVSGIYSASNFKGFSQNLFINRDYRFTQASIGYGHTFNKITLMLNGNKFITGRNTGDGYGGGLSLIYKVDYK